MVWALLVWTRAKSVAPPEACGEGPKPTDAQLILVLEPFGKIDDRGRHQHDPRLLSYLAMKLIELLGQLVAIAGIQERPPNVTAEQIVA